MSNDNPPAVLANSHLFGLSTWDWLAGPSVAMCAVITLVVWTTSGTFMLMFLAALQNLPVELDEASMIDGASRWQRLRYVTLPQLKPTLFLVLTLGLIGTWQVFDQIYVMTQGAPAKTTLTPAFLSYRTAFSDFNYGSGAAISFLLFLIIVVMTLIQRWVMRDRDKPPGGRAGMFGLFGRGVMSPGAMSRGTDGKKEANMSVSTPVRVPERSSGDRSGRPSAVHDAGTRRRRIATRLVGYAVLVVFSLVFLYPFVIQLANTFKTERTRRQTRCRRCRIRSPTRASCTSSTAPTSRAGCSTRSWSRCSSRSAGCSSTRWPAMHWLGCSSVAAPAIFAAILAVMGVPGVVLLIPKFLVLNQLGLYNSYPALILPLLADAAGIFIMKQSFESIPPEMEEAARIDGAGIFRTYWSVVLPMARPALITLTILSFQGSWNEFPPTLVAVQSPSLFTLPRGLADLVSGSLGAGTQYPLKLGAALLATIPVAIIFLVFQRYFVRGANEGGVKG